MRELWKRYWHKATLCASFVHLIYSPIAYTADEEMLADMRSETFTEKDTYNMNFNNVSIIELIRFASKITNLNFVFHDADLQFPVTVVSKEPISAKSLMAALSQVLRSHDLILLEEDGNVLITTSTKINQIAPIVSSDSEGKARNAALVTRIFRIKNASVTSVAAIIRPMCSDDAQIEVSTETRQLIVTDISTNVDQIATLLMSLDAPHSPLEIDSYVVKYISPQDLIGLTEQILKPFSEGNPLIFVSQPETNSIFIVSTPYLIERAMTVMEDLDLPAKNVMVGKQGLSGGKNIFLYNTVNCAPRKLLSELHQIAKNLKVPGLPPSALEIAINTAEEIKETGSLMFVADSDTTTKLKDLLATLDIPNAGKTSFFIYKILQTHEDQIQKALHQMRDTLDKAKNPDDDLIAAIDGMKWIKEANSLVFMGCETALKKLEDILPTFDVKETEAKAHFLIYHPEYLSGEDLEREIEELSDSLKKSGLYDPAFLETLDSMRWVPNINSMIFTGDAKVLDRVQEMLKAMDTKTAYTSKSAQIFIYRPQHASAEQIDSALKSLIPSLQSTGSLANESLVKAIQEMQWNIDTQAFVVSSDAATIERLKSLLATIDTTEEASAGLAKGFFLYKLKYAHCEAILNELHALAAKMPTSSLQNQNLVAAIHKIECVKSTNSLLITGTTEAIEQIKTLIVEFDNKSMSGFSSAQSFLIYKAKYLPAEEIQAALQDLAKDLKDSGLNDPELFQTLSTMKFVAQTNSLLFTGSQEGLDKVQALINGIDTSAALGAIQSIGNLTFLLYKIQSASPDKLISSLKTFAGDLKKSNVEDKQLAEAINGVRLIKETNSLLFTGSNQALEKVEQLVKKFDIPSLGGHVPVERNASTFVIYNPKYLTGDELISILCDFMQNLMESGVSDPGLFDAINNLKWIDKTSSLLISGDQNSIDKVQQLLVKFDVPGKENIAPSIESIDNLSFLVYKLQYHPGNDIQKALTQVAASLTKGTTAPPALVEAINSLQWIEITNSLLCTGQQDVLVKLRDLIENLDIPLRQVFIEVLAIETGLTNTQNFGLQWGSQVKYLNKTILQTGNFPVSQSNGSQTPTSQFSNNLQQINATTTPTNTSIPFTTGFDLGVIGDIIMHKGKSFISLGSLMTALQLDSDSTILLNPKIITQDNRQSTVFVGQNIPYTGALVTNTQANTTQTANIEYRDVGVSLTITPILGDGDVITMNIVQDISEVIGQAPGTSTDQVTGITTSHTHMETRVHVPNNHFVALSGMINDSRTHFRTAIPCLGGLPVIGLLFSENDRTASKNNIIVFVRPQIVNSYQEYKAITEHQEWLYKDNARLPVLKEEFDEGVDMIKLPENE